MALLYSALEQSEQVKYIFLRLGLNSDNLQHSLKNHLEKLEKAVLPAKVLLKILT